MTDANPNRARRDNPNADTVAGDTIYGDKFTGDKIAGDKIDIGEVHGGLHIHPSTNDETAQRAALHLQYLRHWFPPHRLRNVSLANLNSDRDEQADLLDLYVPLPVDFALTVRTKAGQIVDWWGGRSTADKTRDEAGHSQEATLSPRHWPELGVDEDALQPLIAPIQARFAAQQATDRKVYDRDYRQPPFAAHHAAALRSHFILLGDPGSGKSSFLRHLTLCLAGTLLHAAKDRAVPATATVDVLFADWPQRTLDGYTPLYLELHDVVRAAFPAPSAPLNAISDQILWRYIEGHGELAQFRDLLQHLLQQEALILLLDGLDEIPDGDKPARRNQMIAFINALTVQYPALRIVITSRPYAYHEAEWRPTGFGHTALAPLQRDQFQRLAAALFTATACADPQAEAQTFVAALNDHAEMDPKLHANPLLFTLLAALWLDNEERQLPATQADLYHRAVDLLLDQWTKPRVNEQALTTLLGLTREQLRGVLETLACTVHEQGMQGEDGHEQDSTQFAAAELFTILYDADLPDEQTRPILTYLEKKAGLLLSPTPRQFRFSHRSFQEHLAACELTCRDPKRVPPVAADRRFSDGLLNRVRHAPQLWRNVALLAADELIREGQDADLWSLLDDLCQPYREHNTHAASVTVALTMAHRHNRFDLDRFDPRNRPIRYAYDELLTVAHRVLTDDQHFTPEERNIAGELLGRRPEHDTRKGVGCRADGLPDIDWVKIPEADEQGNREFIYQEGERRTEPTFWMARYPVTYGQFQAFIDAEDGFHDPRWWEGLAAPDEEKAEPGQQRFTFWNHPRENVNWYDAIAFCRWLTARAKAEPSLLPPELQGRGDWRITLPTEWQWEKAARGPSTSSGTGRRYPWGGEYRSGYANINETGQNAGLHYLQKTSAVGSYPQNRSPFGIVDMSGNVWEWCLNEYSNSERIQETGDANRVVRGGSWDYLAYYASALGRLNYWSRRLSNDGFRVVVALFVPV